jgi:polyhydroxyalkanoate synthesis regulator phasin
MSKGEEKSERTGVSESLRAAVERTLSATADTAAETAERAQGLLDEVAERGRRTRQDLSGIRLASARDVGELSERLDRIESKLEALEAQSKPRPES